MRLATPNTAIRCSSSAVGTVQRFNRFDHRCRITAVRRLLALSCAIVLVDTIFYAALTPLVPLFKGEFGLSKAAVGILSGAYGAGVLVGSAPGGYLASRSGVRVTALVGLVLMCITTVMFALADTTWLLV